MAGRWGRVTGAVGTRRARPVLVGGLIAGTVLLMGVGAASASSSPPGLFGSLPAAGTPSKGGTISVGFLTGSTPLTIFPIVGDTNASVYTTFSFQYDFFVPLYNGPNGATQEIDYAVSLGKKPTFSNNNQTVTIPLNTTYKWSNGQPVDANDLVFYIDLIKAAAKENPANLASYSPGLFPADIASVSASSKYTVVIHLTKSLNPNFFLNDELESENSVVPLPSTAWNIDSAGGPHLDYTKPANAKKIYDYLNKLGHPSRHSARTRFGRSLTVRSSSRRSTRPTARGPRRRTRTSAAHRSRQSRSSTA